MKNILVPVDFSEHSTTALRNALSMAEKLKMNLILMHSLQLPIGFTNSAVVGGHYDHLHVQRESAQNRLEKMIEGIAASDGVTCTTRVTYGNLAHAVNKAVKENEVGLVIMASSGKNGFLDNLTGSNSYNIVKEIDCPMIVLPENADILTMKHIALAGDYAKAYEPAVFEELVDIAKNFFAHIHVIHVDKDPTLEDAEIDIAKSLHLYLKDVPHSFHFKTYEDIEDGLVQFCLDNEVDLLAMIPRQHSLLDWFMESSVSKQMLNDIPLPLMMLQD